MAVPTPQAPSPEYASGGPPAIIAHGVVRLLASWRTILWVPVATACLTAVVTLIVPKRYESYITILPQTQNTSLLGQAAGGLGGGLAAIAQGLVGGSFGGGTGLDYFAALAGSRTVYDQVLSSPIPAGVDPQHPSAGTLLELWDFGTGSPQKDLELGRRALDKAISTATDPPSGVLTITVRARTPGLALVIGKLLLKGMDDANRLVRDQVATAQVAFIQAQTDQSRQRLEAVEDSLRRFYEANRTYQSSPALLFQEGRLRRRLDLNQSVWVSLSQQLEQARFAAAQNVPVFSVLDPPNAPALRAFPKRIRTVLLVGVLAGVFVVGVLLFRAYFVPNDDNARSATVRVKEALRHTLGELGQTYRRMVGRA